MNRDQYIEMLKSNKFDISLIYEYYNTFNKNQSFTFDLNTFNDVFMQYIGFAGFNIDIIKDYYDIKFKIIYLYNKTGQIIKII
jgi:endonuclease V-like protein UPF0215 family